MVFDEATVERFWSKVDKRGPDECWEWVLRPNSMKSLYGRFSFSDGTRILAHRFSWLLTNGPYTFKTTDCICHTCDNPLCCNPSHLWLGSNRQNMLDCIKKGRFVYAPRLCGEKSPVSKLKQYQVHLIRDLLTDGYSQHTVANAIGISRTSVQSIYERKAWAWL